MNPVSDISASEKKFFTGSMPVPIWMVAIFSALIIGLFWFGINTVLQDRERFDREISALKTEVSDHRTTIAKVEQKNQDVVAMVNGLSRDVQALVRAVDKISPINPTTKE